MIWRKRKYIFFLFVQNGLKARKSFFISFEDKSVYITLKFQPIITGCGQTEAMAKTNSNRSFIRTAPKPHYSSFSNQEIC